MLDNLNAKLLKRVESDTVRVKYRHTLASLRRSVKNGCSFCKFVESWRSQGTLYAEWNLSDEQKMIEIYCKYDSHTDHRSSFSDVVRSRI